MKKGIVCTLMISLALVGCVDSKDTKTQVEDKEEDATTEAEEQIVKEDALDVIIGNTSGNIQNGGIAAEYGDMVFYSDSKRLIASPKNEISDMGNSGEVLDSVEDEKGLIDSINVIDNHVYYVKNEKIYKVGLNGEGKEEVPTSVPVSRMIVYKEQIIFSSYDSEYDSFNLYTMGINGENEKEKATDFKSFYIDQGKLYWSEKVKNRDYRLYIDNLDNEDEPLVKSHFNLESFQVNGDDLYYLENGDNYKMSLDGNGGDIRNLTANLKENGASIDMPNIAGDTIYYTENQKMFAMDTTGSKHWEVPTSSVYAYSIAGGHLFYWGFGQGEYSLAVFTNVIDAYNGAMDSYNQSAEATEGWGTPPELIKLYDDLFYLEEPISIRELEEQETAIVGGEILFPQEHVVGATKALLFGLSNQNEDLLKTLLTDPEGQYNDLFMEALSSSPLNGEPYGGYYDYEITVTSDNSVYIFREKDGLSITAVFKEIDGKYYFDKFID